MYQFGAGTNVGNIRDNNEDSYVCNDDKGLWIVADGMGGLGFGEVASAITTYTVTSLVQDGHGVNQAIEIAHQKIKEYAESDGLGTNMGTTIVLLLSHGSLYNIFWVGDSRAYLCDGNGMKQITVDHSLVQSLIDQGELTKEEAETDPRKNAVTRALGVQELETVRADSISERWQPGQKILLCSDGLTDCVSDTDIEALILEGGEDQEIVDRLIQAALDGGGKDNVTIILVSAPATARIADTDTHVPGDARGSDDTHIPSPEDTQRKGKKAADEGEKGQQLSLNIETESTETESTETETPGEPTGIVNFPSAPKPTKEDKEPTPWYRVGGSVAAALFFLVVIASIQLDEPTAEIPENFIGEGDSTAEPISRDFAEFLYPSSGKILQVGLFKRLEGAEQKQSELVLLGLSPHIEKRIIPSGVAYAVVLGPLDTESHQVATATLNANGLNYFHRQERGT